MGMLFMERRGRKADREELQGAGSWTKLQGIGYCLLFPLILTWTAMLAVPEGIDAVDREFHNRESANGVYEGMKEYAKAHKDCFYFQDVYSVVSYPSEPYAGTPYSEKMFADVDNTLANYDLMGGGWLKVLPKEKNWSNLE